MRTVGSTHNKSLQWRRHNAVRHTVVELSSGDTIMEKLSIRNLRWTGARKEAVRFRLPQNDQWLHNRAPPAYFQASSIIQRKSHLLFWYMLHCSQTGSSIYTEYVTIMKTATTPVILK